MIQLFLLGEDGNDIWLLIGHFFIPLVGQRFQVWTKWWEWMSFTGWSLSSELNWWDTPKRHMLNIRVHKVWCIFFFFFPLRRNPGEDWLSHMVVAYWHFCDPVKLFFNMIAPLYIPTTEYESSSWFTSLPQLVSLVFLAILIDA